MSKVRKVEKIDPVVMHNWFFERYNLFAKDDAALFSLATRSIMRDIYQGYEKIKKDGKFHLLHQVEYQKIVNDLRQRLVSEAHDWNREQYTKAVTDIMEKYRSKHEITLSQCLGRALVKKKNKCGKISSSQERLRVVEEVMNDYHRIEKITFEATLREVLTERLFPAWIVGNLTHAPVVLHQTVMKMAFQ